MIDADEVAHPVRFVRASELVENGATDEEVRRAIEAVEDGDRE